MPENVETVENEPPRWEAQRVADAINLLQELGYQTITPASYKFLERVAAGQTHCTYLVCQMVELGTSEFKQLDARGVEPGLTVMVIPYKNKLEMMDYLRNYANLDTFIIHFVATTLLDVSAFLS